MSRSILLSYSLEKEPPFSLKKYRAILFDRSTGRKLKTIKFGQRGAEDFTIHKDEERKQRYVARHNARENWDDPRTAGFWSRWVLWNKPSLQSSLKDVDQIIYGHKWNF